jgi:hypothetical protein
MKKSTKYLTATALGLLVTIALMLLASRFYMAESIPYVPARTSAADLAQLANFTRITVSGDFSLEVSQRQDYSIDYTPLNERKGELEARVEDNTLIISGFGNRTDNNAATLRIGVPVLDTLEVNDLPEIIVSNFNAPLMNIRLLAFRTFTLQNSVLGNLDLYSQGAGVINLRGNTLSNQRLRIAGQSDLNISSE